MAAGIDKFFGSVPEAGREGVEVGQEETEEAGMPGVEVSEEAEIEGVEGGTRVAEEVKNDKKLTKRIHRVVVLNFLVKNEVFPFTQLVPRRKRTW
ncbi:Hypothetical predicted protein [Olea europaea subsp. europaea]|uniref:Uncharacterized protein n=1 Tax=Olea europaea subsp. europaea TaxID=158383 RepID=A0A8S0RJF4_OLEEU|nr:Hypothetical predicted protein [Olea europaea subsp. europaea]